ncbi:short-chain dehydrogenase [Opitutus sp. ER46]|nr:short-chain dehydrogenase [Opitutus sp. ER46]
MAFAEMLLGEGVEVWGTSRDATRLADLLARYPGRFHAVALDLRDGATAERAMTVANQAAAGFDVIINNAGYGVFGEFAATDFAVWQEQLEVMLVHTARLAHAGLRCLQSPARGGRPAALVNIASLAAEFPLPFQAGYNMCKAGITALNQSLMMECEGSPVVVLDVRPGDYRTDFEGSVLRPGQPWTKPAMNRAWAAFAEMMQSGPAPAHAAAGLRRALARRRSGTVRIGRFFQAVIAPFLARFGSLALSRRVQARYFHLS